MRKNFLKQKEWKKEKKRCERAWKAIIEKYQSSPMKNLKILKKNEMSSDHTKESAIPINHWKSFDSKEKNTGLYGAHC